MTDERGAITRWRRAQFRRSNPDQPQPDPEPEPQPEPDQSES